MSFENEILVSYAPSAGSENQTTSAWTLKFCEYLAILMNRLYDKKTAILLHDDLRAKQAVLGENMHDVLAKTAVFVTILSPEYAKSPAYIRDLEEIHQAASQENRAGKKHRIFKVHTLPLQNNEQLDCLREELSYEFYEINRYNKKPVTFDLNGKNGPHEKFWSKLVDLPGQTKHRSPVKFLRFFWLKLLLIRLKTGICLNVSCSILASAFYR
jgi:hypothetical protein